MTEFKFQHPKNRELLGGDLLAQSLAQLGVKLLFGLHGGHLDQFLVGCAFMGIELVDTRHETVAVQAAEGYTKLSGKIGACFVTANSGYAYPIRNSTYTKSDSFIASATHCQVLQQHTQIVVQCSL